MPIVKIGIIHFKIEVISVKDKKYFSQSIL